MFKFIEFLRKRPKDSSIRTGRVLFGVTIAILLELNFSDIVLRLPESFRAYEIQIQYGLFIFAVVPFLIGITGICIAKRKYVRLMQIGFGFILIIAGNSLIDTKTISPQIIQSTTQSESLDYNSIVQTAPVARKPVNVGFWIALLGILPILAGISGKCITAKCLKYGEVIKKIRV